MKKVMSILLVAVIMLLCLSGCGGDDAKLYFPDNSSLKLTASEEEIVSAQGLVSKDSEGLYGLNDGSLTDINGIKFSSIYAFSSDGELVQVIYSLRDPQTASLIKDKEEISQIFNQLKNYFDSIYGQSHDYVGYEGSGYSWTLPESNGKGYALDLYTTDLEEDYPSLNVVIGVTA